MPMWSRGHSQDPLISDSSVVLSSVQTQGAEDPVLSDILDRLLVSYFRKKNNVYFEYTIENENYYTKKLKICVENDKFCLLLGNRCFLLVILQPISIYNGMF